MSNAWDRPPIPSHGDKDANATYAGVGHVTSNWELLEAELADLFSIFIEKRYHPDVLELYYDKSKTSQGRIAAIAERAERFFQRAPDQQVEGDFCGLMRKIRGFVDRRHEVAHGVVRPRHWFGAILPALSPDDNDLDYEWFLGPPRHQVNWFTKANAPTYVYSSKELHELAETILALWHELMDFKKRL
jgi:hypothetical protein